MRLGFAAVFFLPLLLIARDNPFLPVITPQESGKVAEVPQPDFFMSEEIYLPSSARKLLKVDITYLNMDGSMETVQTELEKDIDWHFPIIVAQEKSTGGSSSQQPKPPKEMKDAPPAPTPMVTDPITQEIAQHKMFKPLDWVSIEIENKHLTVHTENKLLRHFALSEPVKIVLDFERDSNFYSKSIPTGAAYYKQINIGNHKNFYRIAIELDGQYRYDLAESKDAYVLTLQ